MLETKEIYRKLALICSRKEYCVSEIEQKMLKWDLNLQQKETIISNLIDEHFIDELRFTEAFVKDKFRFNKWGKNKIRYHLKQKQISSELIDNSIQNIPQTEYEHLIETLLESKNKSVKAKNTYERKAKLLRFMTQKGFEFDLVNNSLEKMVL